MWGFALACFVVAIADCRAGNVTWVKLPFEKEFGVRVDCVWWMVEIRCVGLFSVDDCCCFGEDVVDGGGVMATGGEAGV